MKIKISINSINYEVSVDAMSYTVSKIQTVMDKKSANYGKETFRTINYPTNIAKVVETICKDALASSDDVVTLCGYVERVEAAYASVKEQLEAVGV